MFLHSKGNNNGSKPYANLPPEAVMGNSLGVLIVAFGLVVLKILSNHEWMRPDSRPEDGVYAVRIIKCSRCGFDRIYLLIKYFTPSLSPLSHSHCFKKTTSEGNLKKEKKKAHCITSVRAKSAQSSQITSGL